MCNFHFIIILVLSILASGNLAQPTVKSSKSKLQEEGIHFRNPAILHSQSYFEFMLPFSQNLNYCQFRLDFILFNTSQGEQSFLGDCSADTLKFVGVRNAQNMGPLCGNLTGQHVYLNPDQNTPMSIQMYIQQASTQQWDILATPIECGSPDLAPEGCLQYHTEPSGTVASFNWNNRQQLNLQDYSICIKTPDGASSITWSACEEFYNFFISGTIAIKSPEPSKYPDITNPLQGSGNCSGDWVMIFGVDKFCGNYFKTPVTTMTQPFMLGVHMNNYELAPPGQINGPGEDYMNYGFRMCYTTR